MPSFCYTLAHNPIGQKRRGTCARAREDRTPATAEIYTVQDTHHWHSGDEMQPRLDASALHVVGAAPDACTLLAHRYTGASARACAPAQASTAATKVVARILKQRLRLR